ncbi:hypothetical protein K2173_025109 [Erythroxylum novogranatense]|uniref:FAS1 domain-containing protein n=1 Tax=Erythroxylum novogranatense TaxID=1862640 RepID=A0AAV8SVH2_9ROSI|nr:hypothetical protein K2173_025109 [Erythroxylum novogranatense]
MASLHYVLLFLALSASATSVSSHNITEMLAPFPEYSQFNSFLTQTKLADEINSRQTITILTLNNAAMSALTAKHPLSVIKAALSLLVLLDYFDSTNLHQISKGTTLCTTLYQTTGTASGNFGFVNITDLQGGKVGLGSAAPGSKLDSFYVKSVKQIPYNISVLEISGPIITPGLLTGTPPSASDVNITAALENAGCKTFAGLLQGSGVIKTYESAVEKGLTIFAPNDGAFKADGVPDLNKLTSAVVVSLLQFHAAPNYNPLGSLKISKDPIPTLATNGAGKFGLSATTAGNEVTLHTGVDSSRVANTIIDSQPLVIFSVDKVLLPVELFGKSSSPAAAPAFVSFPSPAPAPVRVSFPSPAPAPVYVSSPSPSASPTTTPSPTPVMVEAPSPLVASPPARSTKTPAGAPAGAPTVLENSTAGKGAALHVGYSSLFAFLVTATVLCSFLMD